MGFQALIASGEDALVQRFSAALNDIGVAVETVPNCTPAISLLNRRQFEAVLLDCDLDGGMDLVETVRRAPGNQRALVLAFASATEAARMARQRGANFVLDKPINWEIAKRTLRAAHTMIIRERRRSIREKVKFPATVNFERQTIRGTVSDISEGGLAVRVPVAIPLGSQVDIHFKVSTVSEVLSCSGTVAWAKSNLVGVEFSFVPPASARAIVKWLMCHSPRRFEPLRSGPPANQALNWGF